MHKNIGKNFFISEINASELVLLSCLYLEENACH